ncbi:MAG: hypothetical protein OXC26_25880 [Albidovulum sp.]|nr:hypothetical protein [Albidovulum sp.]
MDIPTQVEIVLRDAHYDTWVSTGTSSPVTCFESAALIGFVHVFDSARALLDDWETRQRHVLARHAAALRGAGTKAWNVYSLFLTADSAPDQARAIQRIDEDFELTRKIARESVRSAGDVERALLPLISIRSKPSLGASNFNDRLRARLKDLPQDAVTAFLSDTSSIEVSRILGAES